MTRPPAIKPLTRKHHVCTWVNTAGHTRGLYAEGRGDFVQARISGFGYRARDLIAHSWVDLGWRVQNIVMQWGAGWRLRGVTLRKSLDMPRTTRAHVEARA